MPSTHTFDICEREYLKRYSPALLSPFSLWSVLHDKTWETYEVNPHIDDRRKRRRIMRAMISRKDTRIVQGLAFIHSTDDSIFPRGNKKISEVTLIAIIIAHPELVLIVVRRQLT